MQSKFARDVRLIYKCFGGGLLELMKDDGGVVTEKERLAILVMKDEIVAATRAVLMAEIIFQIFEE
ncbi:hypothetical protein PPS11_03178 [Pseudomonas putida S11]|nr:hypothetical protein PPS11_03178 [Pseudomonas putida S11]